MPTNSTVTYTVTATTTHTTTQQLPAEPFLGIPDPIWIVIVPAIVLIIYLAFKFQVRSVPVFINWLYRNYSAIQLRGKEDLQGIFLEVKDARGKTLETIKKTGKPIQLKYFDNKGVAYAIRERHRNGGLDDSTRKVLEDKGFRIKEDDKNAKSSRKGYVITKSGPETEMAYLDIPAGGMKSARLYTVVEGTGHTLELFNHQPLIDQAAPDTNAGTGAIHEELSAFKQLLRLLESAAAGSLGNKLILIGCGLGLGLAIAMISMLALGFHK